jgi:cytochrome d ubiquinol oxidase subunit II
MVVAVSAAFALYQAREGAPEIYQGLTKTGLGLTAVVFTAAVNLGALLGLLARRDRLARFLAMLGAVSMLWGWALSQFPFLVEPELTIYDAAPSPTLQILLYSLLGGSLVLFPLLWYLYRIFKGRILTEMINL